MQEGPLWNYDFQEQKAWWDEQFSGPKFRLKQVQDWVFKKHILDGENMNNLPKNLKTEMVEKSKPILKRSDTMISREGTADKYLFECFDGSRLESVLLRNKERRTICLSTQVGCALACMFCHTGLMGFKRNLSVAEMVEQILWIAAHEEERISNIVVMGMGEPFLNYKSLMKALRLINHADGFGLGARHVTISTSGIKGGILKLAEEPEQWGLAVSLHAANDKLRGELMPINKSLPLKELIKEIDVYIAKTNRRVSFEYIMLGKVNSQEVHAMELAALLKGKLCHVNLIPFNPVPTLPYEATAMEEILKFQDIIKKSGIACTIRFERGQDILAACGQLAHKHERA